MRLTFWGTRGSLASPGPDRVRYGGNTLCVEHHGPGGRLIIDAGTGLVPLGERLAAGGPAEHHLLLSHFHWDHVLGLPFFVPLFIPGSVVHMYGAEPDRVEETVDRLFHASYSPIKGTENLLAELRYHSLHPDGTDVAGVTVRTSQVCHPAPTIAMRFDGGGRSWVYATDHEAGMDPVADQALVTLAGGADVLVHDTVFTAAEYPRFRGWGHSSWPDAVALAARAGVRKLMLFHYNPDHDDDELDALVAEAVARAPAGLAVEPSRDGLTVEV